MVDAGPGNDVIQGNPGYDVILAGPGVDTAYVTPGDVYSGIEHYAGQFDF